MTPAVQPDTTGAERPISDETAENPDLAVLDDLEQRLMVDTSETEPVYLLATKSGRYLRIAPSVHHLLRERHAGASFEAIAGVLSEQTGKHVSTADVEKAYRQVIKRIGDIERTPAPLPGGFWFRRRILPQSLVARVAAPLTAAFHPAVAVVLLLGMLAAGALVSGQSFQLDMQSLGWGYVLFFLSLLVHEFGHASACARYGARPSDIGIAAYLIYPCFYSNVSAAWRLKRWQRVVVDLGGTYFQLVVAAVYAAAYHHYGWAPLKTALVLIGGSCAFSLNPIFKFDGYWVAADALGVTNLGKQPFRIVKYLWRRLLGKPVKPLPWRLPVTIVLFIYTLLTFAVWGLFLWFVLPYVGQRISAYPAIADAFTRNLLDGAHSTSGSEIRSFFISTYLVVLLFLMLGRSVKQLVKASTIKFQRMSGKDAGASGIQAPVGHDAESVPASHPGKRSFVR